jgi:hypothetical protein
VSYFTFRCGILAVLAGAIAMHALAAEDPPPPQSFLVREQSLPPGPRITPFLQYQAEQAWREDDDRRKAWDVIQDQKALLKTQDELRQKLLQMIGGLPAVKTDLRPDIGTPVTIGKTSGRVIRHLDDGFAIEFARVQHPDFLEDNVTERNITER